ncbi:MAG TPA: glycosyltransferase family 39 protein [Aggregatilineales bacterium]|nr:hypothetical protein [Anaerolineales bacterium]HRE49133.1 glycosyltransferase family 39 protein [Aggregatilineales bacterium]
MTTEKRSLWRRWGTRIALGAALLLMIGHLIVYLVYGVSLLSFPFDYDQGEGFELNDTLLLSQGQSPYRDNNTFPFYASNYPPLYHVILIPFAKLFGGAYWYGRLAGILAGLIAAAAIAYAVQRETRQKGVALLSGLAFLASNYVYHIAPLFRQHLFMVMLETVAVILIGGIAAYEGNPRRQRRLILIALALLLAAGYTKQLAILTCIAVFGWLLLRGVRRAVLYGIGFAAVAGGLFLLIDASTGHQWWINIISANVNDYLFSQYTGLLRQFWGLHGALLILAGVFVVYELYLERLSIYSVWFVVSAAGTTLAGKWGAGDSYFATCIAAMCILAGLFTGRCLGREWRLPPAFSVRVARLLGRLGLGGWIGRLAQIFTPLLGIAALSLFVLYGLAVVKLPLNAPMVGDIARALNMSSNTKFPHFYDGAGWTMGYATIGQIPTAEDVAHGEEILALIRAQNDPRPILSEEAAFSFHLGKPVVTNPTQLLNLYANGLYDPAELVGMIEAKAFAAVIFRAQFYPPPILAAVDRAYAVRAVIPMNGYEYTVLFPKP